MEFRNFNEQEVIFKERTGQDFTTLYEKYYDKLTFFTTKICQDQQSGEDIATDAFIRAVDKIDKYDKDKSQFSTWLFTIAKNMSLQHIKNCKKSISMDIEYDADGTTMKDFLNSDDDNMNVELEHDITVRKANLMREKMLSLKEPYRTVIDMREIQRMPYQAIADELDRNISTVKSQIRNARIKLREQVEEDFRQLDNLLNH